MSGGAEGPAGEMPVPEAEIAVITGGATGIGLGIARAFARSGMTVVLVARRRDRLDEAVSALAGEGLAAVAIVADVVDAEAMRRAADEVDRRFGRLDVLVNNAGIGVGGSILDAPASVWDELIDVNIRGVANGIRAFVPLIRRGGRGGNVINTSSMSALMPSLAGIYSMTKAAVLALSEALHIELSGEGIAVAAYCPGPTHSEIGGSPSDAEGDEASPPYMSAEEAGERVLAGLRRGDLFILTHPEFKAGVVERHRTIEAAFPDEPIDDERAQAIAWLTSASVYGEPSRLAPPVWHERGR